LPERHGIEFTAAAARQVRKLDRRTQARVLAAIGMLRDVPRPPAATTLGGHAGLLRVRVGDHRIVYSVDDGILTVLVVAIGHRREIYRTF
jgi:mRNA interferase RelE/StbE